jgi:hypothetical protein
VQLARRCRDLSVKLQSEHSRRVTLEAEVETLRNQLKTATKSIGVGGGYDDDSSYCYNIDDARDGAKGPPASREEDNNLQKQLDKLQWRCSTLRRKLKDAKEDSLRWKRAVQQEIGEENIDSVLQSGWRGRSQLILTLKSRVKELEDKCECKLTPAPRSTVAVSTGQDVSTRAREELKAMENQRAMAVEQLTEEHKILCDESEELKRRISCSKARTRILEVENSKLRAGIKVVLEKAESDNDLIDELRKELGRPQLSTRIHERAL